MPIRARCRRDTCAGEDGTLQRILAGSFGTTANASCSMTGAGRVEPMRHQARPFSVEIKSRNRSTQPQTAASFASPDDWADLIPPADLPHRDVHADLIDAPASACREFAGTVPRPLIVATLERA